MTEAATRIFGKVQELCSVPDISEDDALAGVAGVLGWVLENIKQVSGEDRQVEAIAWVKAGRAATTKRFGKDESSSLN